MSIKLIRTDQGYLLCDKCDKYPAQFYTQAPTPALTYDSLCAKCAADICLSNKDFTGWAKMMERHNLVLGAN